MSWERLEAGFARFYSRHFAAAGSKFPQLVREGQKPWGLLIACSDSRVDPALLFELEPGEAFVVRNVAALVPPFTQDPGHHGVSAAIEFAVTQLEVRWAFVVGHTLCGGVRTLLSGLEQRGSSFLASWLALAASARGRAVAAVLNQEGLEGQCAREVVRLSLENLLTFPFVAQRVQRGELFLGGMVFDLEEGRLDRVF